MHTPLPTEKTPGRAHPSAFAPLQWEALGGGHFRAPCPLFGNIRIEQYSSGHIVVWSVPGYCASFVDGDFPSEEEAMEAAEVEYQTRLNDFFLHGFEACSA